MSNSRHPDHPDLDPDPDPDPDIDQDPFETLWFQGSFVLLLVVKFFLET